MFRTNKNKHELNRRQVTISQPASVFSYHSNRSTYSGNIGRHEPSAERTVHKAAFRWAILPTWIAIAAIGVSVAYASTLSAAPRVIVSGDERTLAQPAEVYEDYIQSLLRGSVFNGSKLTVDANGIAARTQEQFPEIDALSITIPVLARRPVVRIEVSRPAFIISNAQGSAFYVRADGTTSVKVSDIKTPPDNIVTVDDLSGLTIEQGKLVLSKDTVLFIREILRQFSLKELVVSQALLPAAPNELQIRIQNTPYVIKFDITQDAQVQAGSYFAVRNKLAGNGVTPAEYIDIRVEGRAYYK